MQKNLFYDKFISCRYHMLIVGGQNCIIQPLVSSQVQVPFRAPVHGTASSWLITKVNILRCTVSKTLINALNKLQRNANH